MFRFAFMVFMGWMALSTTFARADDTVSTRVDKVFSAWDKTDTPGLSIAVIRSGKIVYSRGYGMANLEYGVPNAPSTVFHAASVSKQFTAFAVHLLVQEGKLSLDDDVRKYLPELQVQGPTITIRHLLHHTSGLRDQWSLLTLAGLRLDDVITEGDILGLLYQQQQLNFIPGDEELYSNSGYTLLGQIVKRVSGQSLAAFTQARIFGPLGMANTRFQESYGNLVKGRAYSYQRSRAGYQYIALSYSNTGATSLFTTVEDLALWDQNFYDARVGGPSIMAAMQTVGQLNNGRRIGYASGLVIGRYRGLPIVEHDGADAGYRSDILRFSNQHLSVLLLGNASDLNTRELARRVADIYLEPTPGFEAPRGFPAEVELQAHELAPYLGDFEMRPGFVLSFTAEGTRLMVQGTGQPKFPLFASADNRFFTKAFESSVTFDRAGTERSVTALWEQGGQDLPLKRITREIPRPQALAACAGDFYSEELGTLYRLSVRDGKLMLRHPRGVLALAPVSPDVFSVVFSVGTLSFERSASGACDGFGVTTGRVRNLRFKRIVLPTSQ